MRERCQTMLYFLNNYYTVEESLWIFFLILYKQCKPFLVVLFFFFKSKPQTHSRTPFVFREPTSVSSPLRLPPPATKTSSPPQAITAGYIPEGQSGRRPQRWVGEAESRSKGGKGALPVPAVSFLFFFLSYHLTFRTFSDHVMYCWILIATTCCEWCLSVVNRPSPWTHSARPQHRGEMIWRASCINCSTRRFPLNIFTIWSNLW